jgi:hypothetical protein
MRLPARLTIDCAASIIGVADCTGALYTVLAVLTIMDALSTILRLLGEELEEASWLI